MSNTEDTELQAVMRRVQKLLAIAADSRANPAEAASAARMAERVMRKYQLEHADVVAEQLKSMDNFHHEEVSPTLDLDAAGAHRVPLWSQSLGNYIAAFMDCKFCLAIDRSGLRNLRYMGIRSDVTVALWLHRYIVSNLNRCAEQFVAEHPGARKAHTSSFRRGYVAAVCLALDEATQEKRAEMQAESGSRALVVAKDRAVADHFGEWAPKNRKPSPPASTEAHLMGVAEGKKLDVKRRAIEGEHSDDQLLLAAA